MKNNTINIVAQAFYGNRTGTSIREENIDRFVLGYLNDNLTVHSKIDRTIVPLPDSDALVLIYNKYAEAKRLEEKEQVLHEENYVIKPLATIPELNLEIYSRYTACRMPADGVFESLEEEDYILLEKYLAY